VKNCILEFVVILKICAHCKNLVVFSLSVKQY